MARTLQEIYDGLIAEKTAKTELDGINTTSPISVWKNLFWVVAAILYLHETLWDEFSKEIDTRVNEAYPGTLDWYKREALLWQNGYTPTYTDNKWQYSVIDEAARLIQHCSVTEGFNSVIIRVAKEVGGEITPLSQTEFEDFQSYMQTYRKFAGVPIICYSFNADYLTIRYTIYYEAGFDLNTLKANVASAINTYLENQTFSSVFSITKLTDAIQQVSGVSDPVAGVIEAKPNEGSYAVVTRIYNPISGFCSLDPEVDLADTITYIPETF